jgi:site-specific DNA-cytosine methylase
MSGVDIEVVHTGLPRVRREALRRDRGHRRSRRPLPRQRVPRSVTTTQRYLIGGAGGSSIGLTAAGFEPCRRSLRRRSGVVRVQGGCGHVDPRVAVDDCGFRMLTPDEIGRAQAFPGTYAVTGTARDRVRMYGNAVSPPAAGLIAERVMAALDGAP